MGVGAYGNTSVQGYPINCHPIGAYGNTPVQGMPEIVSVPAVFMFTKYPCPAVSLVSELNAAGCPLFQNADADLISCTSLPANIVAIDESDG